MSIQTPEQPRTRRVALALRWKRNTPRSLHGLQPIRPSCTGAESRSPKPDSCWRRSQLFLDGPYATAVSRWHLPRKCKHQEHDPNRRSTSAQFASAIQILKAWEQAGLDLNRVIFDPGVGFGKDALQSLELLRSAGQFRRHGLRVLVGHSRKSFFGNLTGASAEERDLATVGASLALCEQRIDILRVHNVPLHTEAYRGWSHALAN